MEASGLFRESSFDSPQSELHAPVVIIIFNRPSQTRQLINALRVAKPRKIYVIADGPRSDVAGESDLVIQTRAEIELIEWTSDVIKLYSPLNLGLRNRILSGLDRVFELESSAIILEDDCIPAPSFFRYTSELLTKYQESPELGMIAGSNFAPIRGLDNSYFFIFGSSIWGWATWGRFWKEFRSSPQVESWPTEEITEVMKTFSSRLAAAVYYPMLKEASSLNTWDISLDVFMRKSGYLTAVPRVNLVSNVGFDSAATHTSFEPPDRKDTSIPLAFPLTHPAYIEHDPNLEIAIWRRRVLRWIIFSVRHPIKIGGPGLLKVLEKVWKLSAPGKKE